jgi:hypothetical protein
MDVCVEPVADPGYKRGRHGHARLNSRLEQCVDSCVAVASTDGGEDRDAIGLRDVEATAKSQARSVSALSSTYSFSLMAVDRAGLRVGQPRGHQRMRDIETIDPELRLVAALRRAARERSGPLPSRDVADALLDERAALLCTRKDGARSPA